MLELDTKKTFRKNSWNCTRMLHVVLTRFWKKSTYKTTPVQPPVFHLKKMNKSLGALQKKQATFSDGLLHIDVNVFSPCYITSVLTQDAT